MSSETEPQHGMPSNPGSRLGGVVSPVAEPSKGERKRGRRGGRRQRLRRRSQDGRSPSVAGSPETGPEVRPGTRKVSSRDIADAAGIIQPASGRKKSSGTDSTEQTALAEAFSLPSDALLKGAPRQTLPTNANVIGMLPWAFLPRRQYQAMDLNTLDAGSYSPQQLIEVLADAWPDLSLALWNFLRLCASQWSYEVRTPDNTEEDVAGKAILDEIVARVNKNWGGFETLLTQWVMSVVMQGAAAGETVPSPDLDDVDDIVTVQPWTIYFQRDLTQKYIAFQWQPMIAAGGAAGLGTGAYGQGSEWAFDPTQPTPPPSSLLLQRALQHGGFRQLNEITFAYVPLDPDVDDPYGRAVFGPVLQLIAWDTQMIQDLRQWSHVAAFGRIDVSVVAEMAQEMMPPNIKANAAQRNRWLNQYLSQIQQAYNNINPDDAMVHWDNVKVSGVDASGKTLAVDSLIRVLERRVFRALKQLPILMGSNEGTTETWGTLQMEVYAHGIESIQKVVANLVERLLNVSLRLRGHNGVVTFTFEPLRSIDRLADAQATAAEDKNAAYRRDQGWITQDEASIQRTGSPAVAPGPDPDQTAGPNMPDQGSASEASEDDETEGGTDDASPSDDAAPDDDAKEIKKAQGDGESDASEDTDDEGDGSDDSDRSRLRSSTTRDLATVSPSPSPDLRPAIRQDVTAWLDRLDKQVIARAVRDMTAQYLATERSKATAEQRDSDGDKPETSDDPHSGWREPSAQRRTIERNLRDVVAAELRKVSVSDHTLSRILDLHTNAAIANARQTYPPLAEAIRLLCDAPAIRATGGKVELTDEQKDALRASIATMLSAEIPDDNNALADAIYQYAVDAYTAGAKESLDQLALDGYYALSGANPNADDFHLTNSGILDGLSGQSKDRTSGLQQTTRNLLATALLGALISGLSASETRAEVDATISDSAETRGDLIAKTETTRAYYAGVQEQFRQSGVPMNVWRTGDDPDPEAGKTGETPCRDNAYAGAVPVGDAFPSGDVAPPAHPRCECDLIPSGDPSDAANATPWLGD